MQALKLLGIVVGSADNKLHARLGQTFTDFSLLSLKLTWTMIIFGRSFDEGEEAARMIEEQGEENTKLDRVMTHAFTKFNASYI